MSKRAGTARTNKGPWLHIVKAERRKLAEARQAEYDKLTVEQKIAKLDKYQHTATRQRARLAKQLEAKTK
jgi:hypothetical protein